VSEDNRSAKGIENEKAEKLTAKNVPGRNTMVTRAMDRI